MDTLLEKRKERVGYVPVAKVAGLVGAKVWDGYRKSATAAVEARQAVEAAKQQVRAALAKSLKLEADTFDFSANEERITIVRRAPKKLRRAESLRDLTA